MDIKTKICGYAYLIWMNGVPVVCMVQSRDKAQAIKKILESGREEIDPFHVHSATLIPGHQDDLFPEAVERDLEKSIPLSEWNPERN